MIPLCREMGTTCCRANLTDQNCLEVLSTTERTIFPDVGGHDMTCKVSTIGRSGQDEVTGHRKEAVVNGIIHVDH